MKDHRPRKSKLKNRSYRRNQTNETRQNQSRFESVKSRSTRQAEDTQSTLCNKETISLLESTGRETERGEWALGRTPASLTHLTGDVTDQ